MSVESMIIAPVAGRIVDHVWPSSSMDILPVGMPASIPDLELATARLQAEVTNMEENAPAKSPLILKVLAVGVALLLAAR